MNTLLFSDIPGENANVKKSLKITRVMSVLVLAFAPVDWILMFVVEGYRGESAVIASICPVMLILLFGGLYVCAVCSERQYLLVYDDVIKYRKAFSKNEKEIRLVPDDYQITLKEQSTRGGIAVLLIFKDRNGRRILRYSPAYSQLLKANLLKIGCKLTVKSRL